MSPKPADSGAERDLYEFLGVGRDADAAQISKAWRKRTRRAGPGSPEFARLNEAAETLLNPDRRAEYDATLPAPEPAAEPTQPGPAVDLEKKTETAATVPAVKTGSARRVPWGLAALSPTRRCGRVARGRFALSGCPREWSLRPSGGHF